MADKITNYKCPACTGPLHFVGASGKLECDYCGSSYSVEEIEALYQEKDKQAAQAAAKAEQKAATQSDEGEWTQPEGADWAEPGMKSYTCPSCGAELICDETTAATSCPYCGNTTIVPGQLSGMQKPDYIIPFKLSKEDAIAALKTTIRKSPFCRRFSLRRTTLKRFRASMSHSGSSTAARMRISVIIAPVP